MQKPCSSRGSVSEAPMFDRTIDACLSYPGRRRGRQFSQVIWLRILTRLRASIEGVVLLCVPRALSSVTIASEVRARDASVDYRQLRSGKS